MPTKIRINNTYHDGDEVITYATVQTPAADTNIAEWFENEVFPHTGTGRCEGDSWYDVVVVASDRPDLLGRTHDWGY